MLQLILNVFYKAQVSVYCTSVQAWGKKEKAFRNLQLLNEKKYVSWLYTPL